MKTIQVVLLTILIPGYVFHVQSQSRLPEPMRPLAVLEGSWTGEGSQSRGPNDMTSFRQTEEVSFELDKQLMTFRGTGISSGEKEPSFRAFGVMTYDLEEDQVYIHAWTMDGNYTKAPVEIGDGTFLWQFDVEGGTVRYKAEFSATQWVERGEFSPDQGKNWYQFMDTSLSR
jgi:hypothetical protein